MIYQYSAVSDICYSLRGFSLCAGIKISILCSAVLHLNHMETVSYSVSIFSFLYFVSFILMKPFSVWCLEYIESCIETSAVPVEGEHAACDGHVHRHLSGHPANHKHLLSCVRVEGGVVDVLGSPELVLCQARLHVPNPEEVKTQICNIKLTKMYSFLLTQ